MDEKTDWTIPNDDQIIDVPDNLYPLFNKLGMQIKMYGIAKKNEVLTVAHMTKIAHDHAKKYSSDFVKWIAESKFAHAGDGDFYNVETHETKSIDELQKLFDFDEVTKLKQLNTSNNA